MARLAEEKEQLQRKLAEMREEAASQNALLKTAEQLSHALQTDMDLVRHSVEQLGRCLEDQIASPLLRPAHKDGKTTAVWREALCLIP